MVIYIQTSTNVWDQGVNIGVRKYRAVRLCDPPE